MGQLPYQCEEYSVHFNSFERAVVCRRRVGGGGLKTGGTRMVGGVMVIVCLPQDVK